MELTISKRTKTLKNFEFVFNSAVKNNTISMADVE